ncbi:hypothetical protein HWB05_gp004 [Streptomyces phage BRock]|uniref:Uncharacterized protein n=1 Tax=Streptomyces phage BRock TaxID=1913591 RepID=A0A1J0GVQ1_9CAUD|nr:hypothetical protein HWB05_gp004 [Streptomyces phage BRock]APC46266.1 hypothetical protein [Streptomyces phage BRock]
MDDDAYAVPITHCPNAYTIHAHGFRYTCVWATNPANRYVY